MTYWEAHQDIYYRGVYLQPAITIGKLGDGDHIDCALRRSVATQAFRIARPADLVATLTAVFPGAPRSMAEIGIR
jgi:hypothetical protein